jgi:hypothetical protein
VYGSPLSVPGAEVRPYMPPAQCRRDDPPSTVVCGAGTSRAAIAPCPFPPWERDFYSLSPAASASRVFTISLLALAIAILALYVYHVSGAWRWLYVVSSVFALYLNSFVGVVQSFLNVPFLHTLAPKGPSHPQ